MSEIKAFEYNGCPVTFSKDVSKGCMINATEMAKPFGREVKHWFENSSTFEYIEALAQNRGITPIGEIPTSLSISDLARRYPTLVHVVKGGLDKQGTWLHEDVALAFAQWLSPMFAIWCNDRIKELLQNGITATDDIINQILDNPDYGIALLNKLKEERAARSEAEREVAILTHTNKTYTATEVANELGMRSANELNKRLEELGVQFKMNGTWVPKADYASRAWFEIKQEVLDNGRIVYHRKITGLGRKALLDMLGGQPIAC